MRDLSQITKDYFAYMGKNFPQQCASDEFYFFPRSETAIQYLDCLDDLSPEKIQDHVRYVQKLLREVSAKEGEKLEEEIDLVLLEQSMGSFVSQFGEAEAWRTDPTLYVKIPLFAMGRVLSQVDEAPGRIKEDLLGLFSQIPGFLGRAIQNLSSPPEISLKVASEMVQDAHHFHERDVASFIVERLQGHEELLKRNREALEAWEIYGEDLRQLPSQNGFATGEDVLKGILSTSFGYLKPPDEILESAQHAYRRTQERLQALARKIDSRKGWKLLIDEQRPSITSSAEFMKLYENQVQELRGFFYGQEVMTFPSAEDVAVQQTPPYLRSLRATASYSAPLTGNTKTRGVFYLTPGREDLALIATHCPYLSAHETYPGHHILDQLRLHHPNPIRRQIESPLFYEGWACYAEQLLDELGYIQDPRQQLIGLKRQLWRNLRAEADVKLQTGGMSLQQASEKIESLGFSPQRAQRQVRRFALTPGYQLCYFMGNLEISRLRERFSSQLGLKGFHDTLLGGGQIPFHLAERRLESSLAGGERE
jgi:hypothetical protein